MVDITGAFIVKIPWGMWCTSGKWIPNHFIVGSLSAQEQFDQNQANGYVCKCGFDPRKCRCARSEIVP